MCPLCATSAALTASALTAAAATTTATAVATLGVDLTRLCIARWQSLKERLLRSAFEPLNKRSAR
jgi:hypothetical protein